MQESLSYIANDARYSIAIQEFNNKASVDEWVWANMKLFEAISIWVDGLPTVASCNYQGTHYRNILEFHELFRKSLVAIYDPFNNSQKE